MRLLVLLVIFGGASAFVPVVFTGRDDRSKALVSNVRGGSPLLLSSGPRNAVETTQGTVQVTLKSGKTMLVLARVCVSLSVHLFACACVDHVLSRLRAWHGQAPIGGCLCGGEHANRVHSR